MNRDIDRVESTLSNVDKRVVRLETLVEVAQAQASQSRID
jgi:hypothetical protein